MSDTRAWLVGALVVLGMVALVAFGSGRRSDYGRVRAAVGARGIRQMMGAPPMPEHGGRGLRPVAAPGEATPAR